MKKQALMVLGASLAALAFAGCSTTPTQSTQTVYTTPATLHCRMTFSLTGWSFFYKRADGSGEVHCANGQSMPVRISVVGGGLTAGKWHVDDGTGVFSVVHRIGDVLGSYAQAEAHAGVVKSGSAQALTKGPVSLALTGTGEGVDLGVAVGKFTISRE
ncbi:MAG TPA: hypothetical protein VF269_07435 [Rhodanobacteraceae bacterium]